MCVSGYILREEARCLLSCCAGAGGSAGVWMYICVCVCAAASAAACRRVYICNLKKYPGGMVHAIRFQIS